MTAISSEAMRSPRLWILYYYILSRAEGHTRIYQNTNRSGQRPAWDLTFVTTL